MQFMAARWWLAMIWRFTDQVSLPLKLRTCLADRTKSGKRRKSLWKSFADV